MSGPLRPENEDVPPESRIDVGRLWAGGVATAIVAALVAVVGTLACRWLFHIPILAPAKDGAYGDAHTTGFVLVAAVAALVATLIANLLLLGTPKPLMFFHWIVTLATLAVVLYPFSTAAPLSQKVATAAVDLVLGFAIGSLLTGVAGRSIRRRPRGESNGYATTRLGERPNTRYPG
jgi:Family of unknown function (DUF6069)